MNVLASARVFAVGVAALSCVPSAVYGEAVNPEHFKTLVLTETDNNRTVDINVAEEVEVRLPEATDERWVVESHEGKFVALIALKSARVAGSFGRVSFVFRGKKVGTEEIALQHNRGSSVIDRFRVEVRVKPIR
jgi:hypothetical protein